MIRYFFKIEIRNIIRDRYIGLLKLVGLVIGFAVVSIIGQHIIHELSYDTFQSNASNKFLLQEKRWFGDYFYDNTTPYPLGQYIKVECPEAEDVTSLKKIRNDGFIKTHEGFLKLGLSEIVFAEPGFFSFFSFDFLAGNTDELLKMHNPAVISRRIADKFFSGDKALGKTVEMLVDNNVLKFTISGIFETPPANTNFNFEWIGSMHHLNATLENNDYASDWEFTNENYLFLKDETNNEAFLNKIASFYQSNTPEDITRSKELRIINIQHLNLTPGVKKRIILFGSLAILILAISVINFILLSFARDTRKMNQSVLENISGARNKDIFIKHLVSSSIPIFIAIILSISFIYLIAPYISYFFLLNYSLYNDLIGLTALILTIGLMASSWVAGIKLFLMRSCTPADLLRNKFNSGKLGAVIKNSLLTFQLLTFIALVSVTLVMQKQLEYIQSTDLGFNKDHLVTLKLSENDKKLFPVLKDELKKIPEIKSISGTSCPPVANHREFFGTMEMDNSGNQVLKQIEYFNVDKNYFQTMEMSLLDGEGFSSYQKGFCVVNEALIKEKDIEEPIGHQVEFGNNTYTISGILKNFHQHSLHENINPFVIFLKPEALSHVLIRLHSNNISGTIREIKSISAKVLPRTPLEIKFLDDAIAKQYEKEQKTSQMFLILTFLAISIACFGLLGISHLASLQRTKEIGIRKVNGAKIREVMALLNKDFIKWVGIAFLIATPIAYYAMNKWLENFAYKTEMSWWIFALAGGIALVIALLTVSWQSWRAARRNPVEALRYE